MKLHALKTEDLNLSNKESDNIVQVLKDFITEGLDFSEDRINALDCRRRDGFIPIAFYKIGGLNERLQRLEKLRNLEY